MSVLCYFIRKKTIKTRCSQEIGWLIFSALRLFPSETFYVHACAFDYGMKNATECGRVQVYLQSVAFYEAAGGCSQHTWEPKETKKL